MQEVRCTETPDDGAECGGVVGTPVQGWPLPDNSYKKGYKLKPQLPIYNAIYRSFNSIYNW